MSANNTNPATPSNLDEVFEIVCSVCDKTFKFKRRHVGKTAKCTSCGNPILLVEAKQEETEVPEQSESASCVTGWAISVVLHCLLLVSLGGITWWSGLGTGSHAREVGIVIEDEDLVTSDEMSLDSLSLSLPEISLSSPIEMTGGEVEAIESVESDFQPSGMDDIIDQEISLGGEGSYGEVDLEDFLSSSGGHGDSAVFFGVEAKGGKIVYIVDCSGSMEGGGLDAAKDETKKSIWLLEKNMEFCIIFYNNGPIPMKPTTFVHATRQNKGKYLEWIDTITADGWTHPESALEIAYGLKPDAMFLLSDGLFTDSNKVWSVINKFHPKQKIPINTIGFNTHVNDLERIAITTGGTYNYWRSPGFGP